MSTFVYSPGIKVEISTMGYGTIDVTDDITAFSVNLAENTLSSVQLSLANNRRKYDGVFTPNDPIHVSLKRITWLPVFTGFLDKAPYFSVFPKTINLKASCTLKRLKYRPWDPGTQAIAALMNMVGGNPQGQVDGGLRDKVMALMTQVGDWPAHQIHFGNIPADWIARFDPPNDAIGMSGIVGGSSLLAKGLATLPSTGPATGSLPTFGGRVGQLSTRDNFSLTGENTASPRDQWYIRMRLPYLTDDKNKYLSEADQKAAERWWHERRILVVNAANEKGVVCRVVDWGPTDKQYVAEVSQATLQSLGVKPGDRLEFRFANLDVHDGLGPVPSPVISGTGADIRERSSDPAVTHEGLAITVPQDQTALQNSWQGSNGLQPHANAARKFIQANWDVRWVDTQARKSSIPNSEHRTGHAIDAGIAKGGTRARGADLALGNAIAMWFAANPHVFGIRQIIWNGRINTGNGWRPYKHRNVSNVNSDDPTTNTLQHHDHVHLTFLKQSITTAGPMGNGWPGGTPADFNNYVSTTNNGADINQGGLFTGEGDPMLNAWQWHPNQTDALSDELVGERALMNDVSLLPTIQQLTQASQRNFMTAPNGDFIAWFPDYFGRFGTASKIIVRDIEIADEGFSVEWDDSKLVTHQFVAAPYVGYSTANPATYNGAQDGGDRRLYTKGIATVEDQKIMFNLFNIDPNSTNPRHKLFSDPKAILQRFGARPNFENINLFDPQAEYWYAIWLMMRTWVNQFQSTVNLTFMPEVYPGMLLVIESLGIQVYVTSVTHQGRFSENGGFTTTVGVTAPSTLDAEGFIGLPVAGGGPVSRPPLISIGGGGGGNRSQFL